MWLSSKELDFKKYWGAYFNIYINNFIWDKVPMLKQDYKKCGRAHFFTSYHTYIVWFQTVLCQDYIPKNVAEHIFESYHPYMK